MEYGTYPFRDLEEGADRRHSRKLMSQENNSMRAVVAEGHGNLGWLVSEAEDNYDVRLALGCRLVASYYQFLDHVGDRAALAWEVVKFVDADFLVGVFGWFDSHR